MLHSLERPHGQVVSAHVVEIRGGMGWPPDRRLGVELRDTTPDPGRPDDRRQTTLGRAFGQSRRWRLSADGDFLRSVAEAVVQLLMETDVDGLIGAGRHERSAERRACRNGYRERALDTRLGSLQLRIPKLRQGRYFPPFLELRKTTEKALVAAIQAKRTAFAPGSLDRRRVHPQGGRPGAGDVAKTAVPFVAGLAGISKSTVSKLCKDIDDRVHAFLDRPLTGDWPYLWLDATCLKQREGGRIVSAAATIAGAVDGEGKREIVGLHIGPSEAETFWSAFLKSLVRRGLRGTKLVISAANPEGFRDDAHEGLKAAIRRVMGATWQRCRVHWMRNALAYVPKGQQSMASASLRQAFLQENADKAHQVWRAAADQMRERWPRALSLREAPSSARSWTTASTTCPRKPEGFRWPTWASPTSTAPSCTRPTRWNA